MKKMLLVAISAIITTSLSAEELDHASAWVLDGNILTNTVSDWAFNVKLDKNGKFNIDSVSLATIANEGTNKTTVVDLSALTNSSTSACRLTAFENTVLHKDGNVGDANKANKAITGIKFPSTITMINNYIFINCSNLSSFSDFSKIKNILHSGFKSTAIGGELYLPVLTELGQSAFEQTKITHVEIPYITGMGIGALATCKSLETVILPSMTWFRDQAFINCTKLTHLVIPSVTKLGNSVFRATALKGLKLPWCMNEIAAGSKIFEYRQNDFPQLLVHRQSPLAGLDDETINTNSYRNKSGLIVRYGGSTTVNNVDWFYDNAAWNEETKLYDILSTNVTIVAATNATGTVSAPLEIPKKLTIEVVSKDGNGDTVITTSTAKVTAIEACSFKNNEDLTCAMVPKSVTRIGVSAFPKGCYIKVKAGPDAERLVDQLNKEYGSDEDGKPYASIVNSGGFVIIVK